MTRTHATSSTVQRGPWAPASRPSMLAVRAVLAVRALLAVIGVLGLPGLFGCGTTTTTGGAPPESTLLASRTMGPEDLLREVAEVRAPLASLVDGAVGLVYVQAGLTGEDDRPRTFAAARVCGPELDVPLQQLATHLELTARTGSDGDLALRCEDDRCVEASAMEYDAERTFVFAPDASGRLRLVAVALIDPQVPESVLAAYRSWARTAEQSLATAPCGRAYFAAPP